MVFSLIDLGFGAKKTDIGSYAPSTSGVYHQPYENYAPTTTTSYAISPQYTYAVQISSPSASIATKKEDILDVQQKSAPQITSTSQPKSETASSQGLGTTGIVLIAVAAIAIFAVAK